MIELNKEGADNINSDTNDEKTDNKTKTRRQ